MPYMAFLECLNWIAFYRHGYKIKVIDTAKRKELEKESLERWVWDEVNENFIPYMEEDKHKYQYSKKRNCYTLPG